MSADGKDCGKNRRERWGGTLSRTEEENGGLTKTTLDTIPLIIVA